MHETQKIGIAQIGCGYWGPNLLRNFVAQPAGRVKWVVEQSPQRRDYVAANYPQTAVTADLEAVLQDPDIDAVIVATPAGTHFELARRALLAGKHVFVEKPLATSSPEAEALAELAGQAGLTLMVGHTFLYNPAVRYLKSLLEAGELGDLFYIYTQRLNLGQVRSDVNAWWNLAPHDVSILMYLMGDRKPVSVTAHGVAYIQPGIEDVVFATLTWANRVTAHIHVSWLDPGKTRQVTLVGSRKMVVYDDLSDHKISVLDKGIDRIPRAGDTMDYDTVPPYQLLHRTGDILLPHIRFEEPLKLEAAHFLECIYRRQPPLTGARHACDVVAVLAAVEQALQTGGAVTLPV